MKLGRVLALETLAPVLALAGLGLAFFSQPSARPVRQVVEMNAIEFHPAKLQLSLGDTVIWINRDLVPHTATAAERSGWDTGSIAAGDSARIVVSHKGEFGYACSFHPTMKAKLIVQ